METLYLLLATVVLNEISVNFSSLFLVQEKNVSKTFASFGENFEQLSMNIRTEAEKFELRPTFENTINEIKANHLKSLYSLDMNISTITYNEPYYSSEHLKSDIMP